MKMTSKLTLAANFVIAMGFNTIASANVIIADYEEYGVWNAYDTVNEAYAVRFRSDPEKDGFWLVATNGDNPKGDATSHAILYGDLKNNRITAYTYNGENSSNSYETGTLLGTYDNVFSSGGVHPRYGYDLTMFSLDVSEINNALGTNFDGVQIGEDGAGIWFHQSSGSDFTYGQDGSITDYVFDDQSYLDEGNHSSLIRGTVNCSTGESTGNIPGYISSCNSTELSQSFVGSDEGGGSVPAPGGLVLILAGLAGLAGFSRKFRKQV